MILAEAYIIPLEVTIKARSDNSGRRLVEVKIAIIALVML